MRQSRLQRADGTWIKKPKNGYPEEQIEPWRISIRPKKLYDQLNENYEHEKKKHSMLFDVAPKLVILEAVRKTFFGKKK